MVFRVSHCGRKYPGNDGSGGLRVVTPLVMSDSESLQRQLLTIRRISNDTSTKDVRKVLSYVMTRRKIDRPAKAVVKASNVRIGMGILERTPADDPVMTASAALGVNALRERRGGWTSFTFRKRRWAEVEGNAHAMAQLTKRGTGALGAGFCSSV